MENIHLKLEKQNENFIYHNIRRPVSFYDNWKTPERALNQPKVNLKRSRTFHDPSDANRSPSFVYNLTTTVPQNVKSPLGPERHAPTKNSLRHSRKIVHKTTKQIPHKYLPPVIRYHRLAKKLVILQIVLGILITWISVWLIVQTPDMFVRDVPYWSGIPLILASFSGYVLLYCCRKEYPGMQLNCLLFMYKISSISLSLVACTLCFCAGLFAMFHILFLYFSKCEMSVTKSNNLSCNCQMDTSQNLNPIIVELMKINIKSFQYTTLPCNAVRGELFLILLGSSLCNLFAGVFLFWYLYLHWKSRYLYIYSHVSTPVEPSVITNK